jgi:RNA polymerase sigma factor (sigma-70 family)
LDEILVNYTPLILKMASLLSNGDPNLREDLIQEGYIGLYQAIQHYRKERGSFPAFAKACIRNAMISYLRKKQDKRFYLVGNDTRSTKRNRYR